MRISGLKQKNKYHHQIQHIPIREVMKFNFLQIVLIFGPHLLKLKKLFMVIRSDSRIPKF